MHIPTYIVSVLLTQVFFQLPMSNWKDECKEHSFSGLCPIGKMSVKSIKHKLSLMADAIPTYTTSVFLTQVLFQWPMSNWKDECKEHKTQTVIDGRCNTYIHYLSLSNPSTLSVAYVQLER